MKTLYDALRKFLLSEPVRVLKSQLKWQLLVASPLLFAFLLYFICRFANRHLGIDIYNDGIFEVLDAISYVLMLLFFAITPHTIFVILFGHIGWLSMRALLNRYGGGPIYFSWFGMILGVLLGYYLGHICFLTYIIRFYP